ncbi:hypothetical protein EYF80_013153 [Liparis tanakae]|uniref:Uncharacterized protein n=1 Tax=Liparis tanakae TaxID=230148 RepID=A0A4Z2IG09_9TELE|nr:hypothetical protein EYF80_013153 [Liparis tanakae]
MPSMETHPATLQAERQVTTDRETWGTLELGTGWSQDNMKKRLAAPQHKASAHIELSAQVVFSLLRIVTEGRGGVCRLTGRTWTVMNPVTANEGFLIRSYGVVGSVFMESCSSFMCDRADRHSLLNDSSDMFDWLTSAEMEAVSSPNKEPT